MRSMKLGKHTSPLFVESTRLLKDVELIFAVLDNPLPNLRRSKVVEYCFNDMFKMQNLIFCVCEFCNFGVI